MANVNKSIIIGRITQEIQLRYTPKGTAIADLNIATNRKWKNEAGEDQEDTTFIDVTLVGNKALNADKYLFKGNEVYIEGRLMQETWTDKTTSQKRTKHKIFCEHIQYISSNQKPNQPS